ncbi:hypothetical protein [Olsenella profusa]|uniref:Uncharacterized protein n=1 Tax=Olsenella profusa TaxID=138595 RepID=A0ABS2F262_9ACTN|nr:hypothetical protein [Olsenella profusa]MBM6775079.1 hypothetical protein [Olsenella profusa]
MQGGVARQVGADFLGTAASLAAAVVLGTRAPGGLGVIVVPLLGTALMYCFRRFVAGQGATLHGALAQSLLGFYLVHVTSSLAGAPASLLAGALFCLGVAAFRAWARRPPRERP